MYDIQAEGTLHLTLEQIDLLAEDPLKHALMRCIAERNAALRASMSPEHQELHDLLAADAARTP